MTEPDNPDWHAALDRAVPEPSVPADMLDRIDSSVRVTRRRRRWTAAGSSVAAVVVVVAAVTLLGNRAHNATPSTASTPQPLPSPSSAPSSPLSSAAPVVPPVVVPHTHPCTSGDNPEKQQGLLPLPANFVPTQAFECYQDIRSYAGDGTWQVLLGRRLNGDLSALVSALRRPDVPLHQAPSASSSGVAHGCTDDLVIPPTLVLYDATGKAVRARVPVDGCDKPQTGVSTALNQLAVTTVQVLKLQQTQTQSRVDSGKQAAALGCSSGQFKDLLIYSDTGKVSLGGPITWSGPVSLCLYRDDPKDPTVGDFVNGRKLSAADEATVRAATDLPGSAKPCTAKHTEFLEVFDHGNYTTIEVGGCSRVQRPNDGLGAANPTAIAALVTSLG